MKEENARRTKKRREPEDHCQLRSGYLELGHGSPYRQGQCQCTSFCGDMARNSASLPVDNSRHPEGPRGGHCLSEKWLWTILEADQSDTTSTPGDNDRVQRETVDRSKHNEN